MCFNVDTVMRVRAAMWVRRTVNPYDRRAVNAAIDAYRAIVLESRGPSKEQIQALASQLRHDRDLFNFACEVYQASKNTDLFVTCRDMGLGWSFTVATLAGVIAHGERVDRAACDGAVRDAVRAHAFKLGRAPDVATQVL